MHVYFSRKREKVQALNFEGMSFPSRIYMLLALKKSVKQYIQTIDHS
jgi:hypothetical protein